MLPKGEALEEVHRSYIEMAVAARVTDAQRRTFFSVGRHLCQAQGAEAVILGGTDLFLAFQGQDAGFSVIDCADIDVERFTSGRLARPSDGIIARARYGPSSAGLKTEPSRCAGTDLYNTGSRWRRIIAEPPATSER